MRCLVIVDAGARQLAGCSRWQYRTLVVCKIQPIAAVMLD